MWRWVAGRLASHRGTLEAARIGDVTADLLRERIDGRVGQ
jgi:hypothetical protein